MSTQGSAVEEAVACDDPAYAFTTNVEAKDEDQLALKVGNDQVIEIALHADYLIDN